MFALPPEFVKLVKEFLEQHPCGPNMAAYEVSQRWEEFIRSRNIKLDFCHAKEYNEEQNERN